MNQSIRNALGGALVVAALAFSYAAVAYVQSFAKTAGTNAPSFFVSGEGKAVAIPDIAQFSFSVVTEGGTDLASLQNRNTAAANAVIDFLKNEGVGKEDIATEGYNISPRYSSPQCGAQTVPLGGSSQGVVSLCPPPEIVGYTVEQTVSVKVRDLEKIGALLSGVVENGANRTSNLTFTVDDPTRYENEARAEAIRKAQEKARAIAEAGGFRIGKLLSVDEFSYGPIPFASEKGGGFGGSAAVPAPPVEPGSQEITVTVNLRYEIR